MIFNNKFITKKNVKVLFNYACSFTKLIFLGLVNETDAIIYSTIKALYGPGNTTYLPEFERIDEQH